jgi:hypothetical protein
LGGLAGLALLHVGIALLGAARVWTMFDLGHSRLRLTPELRISLLLEPRLVVRMRATVLLGRLLLIWALLLVRNLMPFQYLVS